MITVHIEAGVIVARAAKLNLEQAPCLDSHEELAVSAGAGAGKTFTLAARFAVLHQRLIATARGDGDPRAVLVLTFSERAAGEMRERCFLAVTAAATAFATGAQALVDGGVAPAEVARQRQAWERLRDGFGGASIWTFHGFCSRILREFPVESGTAPGFGVLDEGGADDAVGRAVEGVVTDWLQEAGEDQRLLLRTFGALPGLLAVLGNIVRRRGEMAARWARNAGRSMATGMLHGSPISVEEAVEFLTGDWLETLRALEACGPAKCPTWTAEALAAAGEPLPTGDDENAAFDLLDRYRAAVGSLATEKGRRQMDRAIGAASGWRAAHRRPELLARLLAMQDRLDGLDGVPGAADAILARVLLPLNALAEACIAALDQDHGANAAVDYTDLQLRAARAIGTDKVADILHLRHRYLMIDEFQDTDAIQWQIVRALGRPPMADPEAHDRIFVVGDIKQAIYGFRGGDVEVFELARESLAGQRMLVRNHRSVAGLIAFYNQIFETVLGPPAPGRPRWEAPFSALEAHRSAPVEHDRAVVHATHAGDEDTESHWIAAWISSALDPSGPLAGLGLWDRARHPHAPIAILLRTRTPLPRLEAALREAGIPAHADGGGGFWARPEVSDLVDLLHALTRGDAIARISALRSPLFGLDDDTIVAIGTTFSPQGPLNPGQAELLADAARVWTNLETACRDSPAAGALEAAIRGTRADFVAAAGAPNGRGTANINQLLTLADACDRRGGSLDALVDQWVRARADGQRDAEAALPSSDARVTILTAHGSKGLEWPVVIVPFLQMVPQGQHGVSPMRAPDGDWDLAFKVVDPHSGESVVPARLAGLRRHAATLEDAEARRLLYVACTRAEDLLVMTSSFDPVTAAGSERAFPARSWLAHVGPWALANQEVPPAWATFLEITEPPPAPALPAATFPAWVQAAAIPPARRVTVLPSSLGHGEPLPAQRRPESEGSRAAAVMGVVVHGLLEDDLLDDRARAQRRWRQACREEGLSAETGERLWRTITQQLDALTGSEEVRALLDQKQYRELPFRYTLPGPGDEVVLHGSIDLLGRDPLDGAWIVVDHKTVRDDADDDALIARYRWQLLAYSVAASAVLVANGQSPVRRGALLLTRSARILRLPDWTDADFDALNALLQARRRIDSAMPSSASDQAASAPPVAQLPEFSG